MPKHLLHSSLFFSEEGFIGYLESYATKLYASEAVTVRVCAIFSVQRKMFGTKQKGIL